MDRLGLSGIATIGLTGGIGSGKSTVARLLQALGAHLVDTDAIARQLTLAGGAAIPAVAAAFGPESVAADGSLDRDRMRTRVFSDTDAKRRLEAILHPLISDEAHRQATLAKEPVVVFDVPLLAESAQWRARVQRVLVVDCLLQTQVARVAARPGWTAEAALRVAGQQASRASRRHIADAVIFNDSLSMPALEVEVRALWTAWQPDAAAQTPT